MSGPQGHDPAPDTAEETQWKKLLACPRAQAEQLLASARDRGDRRAEAATLTDLAVMAMNDSDARTALDRLKEALPITRELGDRTGEADVVGNFGLLALTIGDPALARHLFEQELAFARAAGDRFAEKTALERLGLVYGRLGDRAGALGLFEEALALARAAGDRQHETTLFWQQAIQHAELGQRHQAASRSRQAIEISRNTTTEQADLFATHLERYLQDDGGGVGPLPQPPAFTGGAVLVSAAVVGGGAAPLQEADGGGPGWLRKGLALVRSMTRFVRSGFQMADAKTLEQRLRRCATCAYHTGLRCKICGCFTNVKTRMAHEVCPAGKWPA
jgi:tetratricopeptide (TPR) repeat protein